MMGQPCSIKYESTFILSSIEISGVPIKCPSPCLRHMKEKALPSSLMLSLEEPLL